MDKRVFLIVLDSFGIGYAPDANLFGDEGANTLKSCFNTGKLNIPILNKLGLFNIDGINFGIKNNNFIGSVARLQELSASKDTTAGHWELAGLKTDIPFPTFTNSGFPDCVVEKLKEISGRDVVCNKSYSGTEVIMDYYKDAMDGKLILYTSADSVLQIAAHEDIVSLEELYSICKKMREYMMGGLCVGRIIARPFIGEYPNFIRTPNRHDFSVDPIGETMLDRLKAKGKEVISVGKIASIFNDRGITKHYSIKSNDDGENRTIDLIKNCDFDGLCFINLVDFDSKYGHRNDANGYANALNEFDKKLKIIIDNLSDNDTLIITADHGCDPTFCGTDHTREYVPLLMFGNEIEQNCNLGTIKGFDYVSKIIEKILLKN